MNTYLQRYVLFFISLFCISFLLTGCIGNVKDSEDVLKHETPEYKFTIQVKDPHTLKVSLNPQNTSSELYFSFSFYDASQQVSYSSDPPDDKTQNASTLMIFKQISPKVLSLLLYKNGVNGTLNKDFFQEPPVTDLNNTNLGFYKGFLDAIVVKKAGLGTVGSKGFGSVTYDEKEGYQFLIHVHTKLKAIKILVGTIKISFVNPGLQHVILTEPIFLKHSKK